MDDFQSRKSQDCTLMMGLRDWRIRPWFGIPWLQSLFTIVLYATGRLTVDHRVTVTDVVCTHDICGAILNLILNFLHGSLLVLVSW